MGDWEHGVSGNSLFRKSNLPPAITIQKFPWNPSSWTWDIHCFSISARWMSPLNEMIGSGITLMNQRVMHFNDSYIRFVIVQWRDVRVVFPQRRSRRTYIGQVLAGKCAVEIAYGRGQHDRITGAQIGTKYEFLNRIHLINAGC